MVDIPWNMEKHTPPNRKKMFVFSTEHEQIEAFEGLSERWRWQQMKAAMTLGTVAEKYDI